VESIDVEVAGGFVRLLLLRDVILQRFKSICFKTQQW